MKSSRKHALLMGFAIIGFVLAQPFPAFASCDPNDFDYKAFRCPSEKPAAKAPAAEKSSGGAEADEAPGKVLTATVDKIPGPKRVVAVGRVNAIGAFTAKHGTWDIGGGLGAMLTTALVESGRFVVIERAHLKNILTEQELKGKKVTNQGTGPELGKLIGAQFLIFGSVTEFGTEEGGGMSLGASGGGFGSLLSGALSRQTTTGTVAMDFRIVDTTSGQVLKAFKEKEEIDNSSWDVSGGYKGISLGTNKFNKTPLGRAARAVITRAVQRIAGRAKATAWTGQVVTLDGSVVYINAGANSGLKVGDTFMVERIIKRLTDPVTNEVLMLKKKELGIVEVKTIAAKIASGPFQPLQADRPKRGDLVVVLKK